LRKLVSWSNKVDVIEVEEVFEQTFPVSKRENYKILYDRDPWCKKSLTYTTFVKNESSSTDPRIISQPSTQYHINLSTWTIPLSKTIAKIFSVDKPVCYASGLTQRDLGRWMDISVQDFNIFLEADFSRFDMHVNNQLLNIEYGFYNYLGCPSYLIDMFNKQKNALCKTRSGIEYQPVGTRKSGDPNTSIGNSLLNIALNVNYLKTLMIPFRIIVLGDDTLIALQKTIDIEAYTNYMARFGMVVKPKLHYGPARASFCSMWFYPTIKGFIAGPKPGRQLNKMGWKTGPPTKNDTKILAGLLASQYPGIYYAPYYYDFVKMHLTGKMIPPAWSFQQVIGTTVEDYIKNIELPKVKQPDYDDMIAEIYGDLTKYDIGDIDHLIDQLLVAEC
jgi:hypothetical protein